MKSNRLWRPTRVSHKLLQLVWPIRKQPRLLKLSSYGNDPDLAEADLITYCRSQLTGYKVPRHVEFVDELPKSNIGKILRRGVREKYGEI